jgi:hypothetical protein
LLASHLSGLLEIVHDLAVQRAEKILLPAFDSWLSGGDDANPVSIGVVIGTLTGCFTSIGEGTRRVSTPAQAKTSTVIVPVRITHSTN